jgi:isopentenyl diphosphate isomerase/L-lactate dehydrogenase-like FMN-dependent dehydrogenase
MLIDVETCTTATTVLGQDVSMPVLVAPVAFQRVAHPDGEVAMARAAMAAGTIMCLSTIATSTPAEVAATGAPLWFQLYVFRDEGITRELIEQARDGGFRALVLTIDAPVRGNRERDVRSAFTIPDDIRIAALGRGGMTPMEVFSAISPSLTWHDLERICGESGLPLLVKGVLTAEDARLACEHGASGIVVSNHGGRQLDGVSATIDVLEEVVDAVEGRVEVLVDGGIRRGTDIVTALALGARAVLAGRAPLWGLAVGGEQGARRVLEILQAELYGALQLVGCTSPAEVTRDRVGRPAA